MGADMGRQASQVSEDSASRFEKYVGVLTSVVVHADRAASMHYYCVGLVAAEGRKSVEPMAAVTAPTGVSAQHQRLLHFVANAPWSDERMLAKVREVVVPEIERHGPIEVWIIDDTSFPKQGRHSVGVHHQYCGQLGKQANCQVAVTLSIANHHASLPIAYRLYLPREWAEDAARRQKAHVPRSIRFGCAGSWRCWYPAPLRSGRRSSLHPPAIRRPSTGCAPWSQLGQNACLCESSR